MLAIDQGTTGTTVQVLDRQARVLGRGYALVQQHYPQPGWVEHDARQIWQTVLDAAGQALAAAGHPALAAVGITNQRETTVLWDRATGEPIGPAIVWQCRRTAARCDQLRREGHAAPFLAHTGLVLDAYFSGTKVEWLLDQLPGARQRAERGELAFGTIDSWLLWHLTGGTVHATDVTNASRTLLFDIGRGDWSEEQLEVLHVPASVLPTVRPSAGVFGHTATDGGASAVIPGGVPIAGMAGDQQAALFGQNCFSPGEAKTTYGTGCFLLLNTGQQRPHSSRQLLTTLAAQLGQGVSLGESSEGAPLTYALEGSVFIGGAVVQWLRDELGLLSSAAESQEVAESLPDSGGVYVVPAFTGLGAPYWDQQARGTIVGLTRGSGRAHIVRASLEGIAHQVADVLDAMEADAGQPLAHLRVDGGAAANDFLMQFQADLLDRPVERPTNLETTALGAATLAGLATGFWSGLDELRQLQRIERRFEPHIPHSQRDRLRAGWADAIKRTRS